MITRAQICQFITPFRLDFAYEYMGRRNMKRYSRYEGDFHDLVETPGGELKSWASDYEQRFVWDGGLSGGYGNLSASYFYDSVENGFAGADKSYAWGPDLSGTEQSAAASAASSSLLPRRPRPNQFSAMLAPITPPTATESRDLHQLPVAGICQSGPPLLQSPATGSRLRAGRLAFGDRSRGRLEQRGTRRRRPTRRSVARP